MLLFSGALICIVITVNSSFLNLWVGSRFDGGLRLILLVAVSMLLRHSNLVFGYTLFSLGYQKRTAVAALIDGMLSTGGSLLLVPVLGMAGAPLGAIVGSVVGSLSINLWTLSKALDISVATLVRPFLPWLGRFMLASGVAILLARLRLSAVPSSFLALAAIVTLYATLNYTVIRNPPLGIYLVPDSKESLRGYA